MPTFHKNKNTSYLVVFLLFLMCSYTTQAQKKFNIQGNIKIEKGSLEGTSVSIEKDGAEAGSRSLSSSSKIDLSLDFNSTYILTFKKSGYVTKRLLFETKVSSERQEDGFETFIFNLVLFKQYEGVNTVVFNQPVGKIYFNPDNDEFAYDTDYTKAIQAQINEVMKEVAVKQKEEEKNPPAPKAVAQAPVEPKPEPKPVAQTPPPVAEAPKPTPTPQPARQVAQPAPQPVKDVVEPARAVSTYVKPTPPPATEYKPYIPPPELVVMSFFTAAQYGSSDTLIYGYINYGDGKGLQPLKKDDFKKYRGNYYDEKVTNAKGGTK